MNIFPEKELVDLLNSGAWTTTFDVDRPEWSSDDEEYGYGFVTVKVSNGDVYLEWGQYFKIDHNRFDDPVIVYPLDNDHQTMEVFRNDELVKIGDADGNSLKCDEVLELIPDTMKELDTKFILEQCE